MTCWRSWIRRRADFLLLPRDSGEGGPREARWKGRRTQRASSLDLLIRPLKQLWPTRQVLTPFALATCTIPRNISSSSEGPMNAHWKIRKPAGTIKGPEPYSSRCRLAIRWSNGLNRLNFHRAVWSIVKEPHSKRNHSGMLRSNEQMRAFFYQGPPCNTVEEI